MIDIRIAQHRVLLWILSVVITLAAAVYQRMTGPTYPLRGTASIGSELMPYRLPRTETVGTDVEIALPVTDADASGFVRWRRYKSFDDWADLPMQRDGDRLIARLPQQPPAGKLMYRVFLRAGGREVSLTGDEPVVLRYKGAVPDAVLLPHVVLMLLAMIWSNRTMLEALDSQGRARRYMICTIALLIGGGFIFGPAVQYYAFGTAWSGVPFGHDLTDNKTLVVLIAWLWAWWMNRGERDRRGWILLAGLVMFLIFIIPHSLLGSELDHTRPNGQSPAGA